MKFLLHRLFIQSNMRRKRCSNLNTGVTLVELLVSMGLLSILLIILTGVFISALDLQLRSESVAFSQQDAQFALTRVVYDIRRAQNILAPASLGAQSNSLSLQINSQTWVYSLSDGNLIVTNPQGTFVLNSAQTTVTQFAITRTGNASGQASVQIQISVESRINGRTQNEVVSYTTTAGIRS